MKFVEMTLVVEDLAVVAIPPRDFSVYLEISPFVQKVFVIPKLVAYYAWLIGVILMVYSCFRMFCSFMYAFTPRPGLSFTKMNLGAKIAVKGFVSTAKGSVGAFRQLKKVYIFVPLALGIAMMCIVSLWAYQQIDELDAEIRAPLISCDLKIRIFLDRVNNFTTGVPEKAQTWIDQQQDLITSYAFGSIFTALDQILSSVNGYVLTVQDDINSIFSVFSVPPITLPTFDERTLGITTPNQLIPHIPHLNLTNMMIPDTILSLNRSIGPWVDDQMNQIRSIATTTWWIGFCIMILPAVTVVCAFFRPFTPHPVEIFFLEPTFLEEEQETPDNPKDIHLSPVTDA